jgi:phosphoribosylformylglycinamidine (FGAM) synthase-like enzyme
VAVALAHMVMASRRVVTVQADAAMSTFAWMFGESTGRIVFTTRVDAAHEVERGLGDACVREGVVGPPEGGGRLIVQRSAGAVRIEGSAMSQAFHPATP